MRLLKRTRTSYILLPAILLLGATLRRGPSEDWPNYGNDSGRMRYSPLIEINTKNVGQLAVSWEYDLPGELTGNQSTPIVVDGLLFSATPRPRVVALDPATGKERWSFDPYGPNVPQFCDAPMEDKGKSRGVAYWRPQSGGPGRVVFGFPDGRLFVVDGPSGKLVSSFGQGGVLDLRKGLPDDGCQFVYGLTSPPSIYKDLAVIGIATGEWFNERQATSGDIRAFDLNTGKEAWRFHTVPQAGERGHETWEKESWKNRGGVNAWSGVTIDQKRGIVFAGLGTPTPDFYGSDRLGENLYANSLIALDAKTGQLLWHRQLVHHDLWDYDLAAPPTLVTLQRDGKPVDAVVQATKMGMIYVFDRETGKPLFDIVERPVPTATDIPGERPSPTQPFPVLPLPLVPQRFDSTDITDTSPEAHAFVLDKLRGVKFGQIFDPPSLEPHVSIPGIFGGVPWSGGSFDPTTGLYYVNSNNTPQLLQMVPTKPGNLSAYNTLNDGPDFIYDMNGYPASKPPWGLLTAVDLNTGKFVWRAPLGEYPALTAKGIPPTGTMNFGGTIVTAGGLVFVGGTLDTMFRAYDKATGKVLWSYKLPAGAFAVPSTYAVDGRQYVVISAGGHWMQVAKQSKIIAFALPKKP